MEQDSDDKVRAKTLKTAVEKVQTQIDDDFNKQLRALAPTFALFGYPGLSDPKLRTETQLDVQQLLSNHTTVTYSGPDPEGINLPESYNGLGFRNLIFILLKLFEFFREFTTRQPESRVHLIFIEEPEAHLHPQMQSVFIRQLNEIRSKFEKIHNKDNADIAWPVQFVVTTHSSHIANEASLDSMRYFLAKPQKKGSEILSTRLKDLCRGLSNEEAENRNFLHQYMTLTRCDLLFADGAILVEGTTERLILPTAIKKFDSQHGGNLGGKYLSIMEVGGAYAHLFYNLVDFLDIRSLIVTDLDSVDANRKKCKVSEGTHSSNTSINRWFSPDGGNNPTLVELLAKTDIEKSINSRRIAYQIPHAEDDACGRSFEDAFILANPTKFEITGPKTEKESQAWKLAPDDKKSKFALEYAINDTDWEIPRYIDEGLRWLGNIDSVEPESDAIEPPTEEDADA